MQVARSSLSFAALAIGFGASAAVADAPATSPPRPPPTSFEHDMLVRLHMHGNYDATTIPEAARRDGALAVACAGCHHTATPMVTP